jgi:plastocyanin
MMHGDLMLRGVLAFSGALLVFACRNQPEPVATNSPPAPAAREASVVAPLGGSTIRGVVSYTGRDTDVPLPISGDPFCAATEMSSESIVGDGAGHLGNVVVFVKSGPVGGPYAVPAEPAVLEQKGCRYFPHVLALRAGQRLRIVNSDATLHNIHGQAQANPSFNVGQPFAGMELFKTFEQREVAMPLRCSVHPWMLAWVAVLEHPFFAVSREDGGFEIGGLAAGTYTLEAWHETLGTLTAEATVVADGVAEVAFPFVAPRK